MSRPGRPPRAQQRLLTPEDEALWSSVARTLEPVRKKGRVHKSAEREAKVQSSAGAPLPSGLQKTLEKAVTEKEKPTAAASPVRTERMPPPVAEFDRRQVRRLARGRAEVEARLDLHGMRATEAYGALRAFLFACYARGQRSLLIITGKGNGAGLRDRPFELHDQGDRGVLRRNVPMWLSQPELRTIIHSFTQAHSRHGGEGALYVQLRRARRAGEGG